jgi:hypothetical protein
MDQKQAQIAQMRQAAVQANDPVQMQLANSQTLIDTLFGDPEIQKAKEIETVISDSMNLEKEEGEDDLDFQIRQQKAIREGTAKLDPNVAVQANQQLAQLQVEREERDRLLADRAEDKELFRRETKAYEHENTHVILAKDRRGNTRLVKQGEFDDTPKTWGELEREKAELAASDTENTYEVVRLSDLLDGSARDKDGEFKLPVGAQKTFFDGIHAVNDVYRGVTELSTSLKENMFALTVGGELEANAASLGTRVQAESRGYYGAQQDAKGNYLTEEEINANLAADETMISRVWGNVEERIRKGNKAGAIRAQVKELAYKLAKTLDPGGRLSDQDVDMAIEMIVGNGDPTELARLLKLRLDKTYAQIETRKESALRGEVYGKTGYDEAIQMDALRKQADAAVAELAKQIQEWKKAEGQKESIAEYQRQGQATGSPENAKASGEPESVDMGGGWTVTYN